MLKFKTVYQPVSFDEALALNEKKSNVVIGGNGWLRFSSRRFAGAIDLGLLGLDKIEETEDAFEIGAMVSLRRLETDSRLNEYFSGVFHAAFAHIVGVQFRNSATVGGSVWGRFGFSDVITLLAALDCEVELMKAGKVDIREFLNMKKDSDIISHIIIKKGPVRVAYRSFSNTATDLPVINVAVSKTDGMYTASVGARPAIARTVCGSSVDELTGQVKALPFGSNMRASAAYRRHLAEVLTKEAANEL